MNYNCHKVGGITAGIYMATSFYRNEIYSQYKVDYILSYDIPSEYIHIIPIILIVGMSFLSSTWPDIDHTQSELGKRHPYISSFLNRTFGHRGLTHYPILVIFMGIFFHLFLNNFPLSTDFYNVLMYISIGILAGYTSHIIMDTFNSGGIAWLAPFSKMKFKVPTGIKIKKIRTKTGYKYRLKWRYLKGGNTFDDFIIIFVCVCLSVFFLYIYIINV